MMNQFAPLSIWEKESFFAPRDIIIIGSGLAGLWSAYHLKQRKPSLSITIVERGLIPTGASTRNAGFACFGSLTELVKDYHVSGEDAMLELVELRYRGLEQIQKMFPAAAIDFEFCGGYELLTPNDRYVQINQSERGTAAALKEDIDLMNKTLSGVLPIDYAFRLADHKISEFGFGQIQHLVENPHEGYLHSGRYCQLLLQKLQTLDVTILNGINVDGYTKASDAVLLHTSHGFDLKATQVLLCTNAFTKKLMPGIDIVPARGQILVTSPLANLPFKGAFHGDEGFYYFRNLGDRILLGGARNLDIEGETSDDPQTTTRPIQEALEKYLKSYILPNRDYIITDRWSGIMGMGKEKLPIVKEVEPSVFCAARMSGMGVALTPSIGARIASLMLK
jgi:glycine/D-amino acid oxidase-like deaminating enzyme